MFRACLVFAFILTLAISAFPQTNAVDATQVPGAPQPLPKDPKAVKDSVIAADSIKVLKAKKKSKSKSKSKAAQDSAQAVKAAKDSAAVAPIPLIPLDTAKSPVPAPVDSSKAAAQELLDTSRVSPPPMAETQPAEIKRETREIRLFNDPKLIAKEYGFGVLGSLVAGSLGFFIGSGIETAIEGASHASQGTLKFTGIRYDNYDGAFWGGATGIVLGSAFTTYFIGQTEEENGGIVLTLVGSTAAAAGAFYIANLMGANDDVNWMPFIPLLAIPSLGGTLGFNLSRLHNDRKREEVVGHEASVWVHPPGLAWGRTEGGNRLEVRALNLTF